MYIKLPRNIKVDITNIPDDFEIQIQKSFKEFTQGTSKEYTYQDKLIYIDLLRKYVHKAECAEDCVIEFMKNRVEYTARYENDVIDKEDMLSVDFMSECFEKGRTNLYTHYENIYDIDDYISHFSDKIMKVLYRAIYAVITYENE